LSQDYEAGAVMHRNALAATDFFRILPNRVIELRSNRAAGAFTAIGVGSCLRAGFLGSGSAPLAEAHAGASAIFFDELNAGLFESGFDLCQRIEPNFQLTFHRLNALNGLQRDFSGFG
jgi:hypothetical protein